MKKLLVVLAILFIGILLAGCTSQPATPAATPTPTAVPTAEVTTAVPTAAPTAVATPNVTANVTPNATPTPTPTPAPRVVITFTNDLTISPSATVYVKPGTIVVFKNDDAIPDHKHGVVANNIQTGKYFGGMGNMIIPYGQSLQVTFDTPGAYDYTTLFQPQVQGKIIVTS